MRNRFVFSVQLCITGITGGRGVSGTLFVHKIAGAAAASGLTLSDVHKVAVDVSKLVGSMGVALTTCTVPGAPASTRLSSSDMIEIGMGIHGEPGREQFTLPIVNSAFIVARIMVDSILSRLSHVFLPGCKIAVLVNNLGGLPVIEMLIVTNEIFQYLIEKGYCPIRSFNGPYMTSLEMNGVSISLLNIDSLDILSFLDQHTDALAWIKSQELDAVDVDSYIPYNEQDFTKKVLGGPSNFDSLEILRLICLKIIEIEPELTKYDSICGDGDCGLVMKAGAVSVLKDLTDNKDISGKVSEDSAMLFDLIANSISNSMGGTSGALLELFFRAAAVSLVTNNKTMSSELIWGEALFAGVESMKFYGGASLGMRTMLDALIPAIEILKVGGSIRDAALAANDGLEKTKTMESLAGRSNYVNKQQMDGIPDPGAAAVAAAFQVAADYWHNK